MATRSERRHTGLRQRPAREQRLLQSPVSQKLRRDRDCDFGQGETRALHEASLTSSIKKKSLAQRFSMVAAPRGATYRRSGAAGMCMPVAPWSRGAQSEVSEVENAYIAGSGPAGRSTEKNPVARRGDAHTLCCPQRAGQSWACLPPRAAQSAGSRWRERVGELGAGSWDPQRLPLSRG